MNYMNIDIETFSDVDLRKEGVYSYVESPKFEILMIAFSVNGGEVSVIDLKNDSEETLNVKLIDFEYHLDRTDILKYAFNANFERVCLAKHFNRRMPPREWRCTMVNATRLGLPASLKQVGEVLNIEHAKDPAGAALIRYFSIPCRPTKANGMRTRNLPHHDPEKWEKFLNYCKRDVEAEMEIGERIKAFLVPKMEQMIWSLDQEINDTGILLDYKLVEGAVALDNKVKTEDLQRSKILTGLDNPNSQSQLRNWFEDEGYEANDVTKATIKRIAKEATGKVKEVAELRLDLSKTSVKKYTKMADMSCLDHRVRGTFQFYGASRTGRWAGRGVQLQNLTKHKIPDYQVDIARELIKAKDFESLDLIYEESPQDLLSQLVRTAFIADKGNLFYVSYFSAIEARVIAWYAEENWRLDVFKTHGKIYEASASQMFNIPIEQVDTDLRQKGKVAELALGYQGGAGALKAMGAIEMGVAEEELPELVKAWRQANQNIVSFWYRVQEAAIACVETRQVQVTHGLIFRIERGFMTIELPSGRKLSYPKPVLAQNSWGSTVIKFKGIGLNNQWGDIDTYGGKLVENIVQATARDILAESMIKLRKHGYKIVGHVHDEVIIEHSDDAPEQTIKRIEELMGQSVDWAEGLPLGAEGFYSFYYKKD